MFSRNDFAVTKLDDGLAIQGKAFLQKHQQDQRDWEVVPFDDDRYLLRQKDGFLSKLDFDVGAGKCDINIFSGLLYGLCKKNFSGVLNIDTSMGVKRLFFHRGEIVFAASNLIDDRLGEVIYREGMISLDQMTDSAVKVNRETKFGRVLLNCKVFSTWDLWEALKLQVMEIIRSIFLTQGVYYELKKGLDLAPTVVALDKTTEEIIQEYSAFGTMYRDFVGRISQDSRIELNESSKDWVEPIEGTFDWDVINIIRKEKTVGQFIINSKLTEGYSYIALFNLMRRRMCNVTTKDRDIQKGIQSQFSSELKTKIDSYHLLLRSIVREFEVEKIFFPIDDLHKFVDRRMSSDIPLLFLEPSGEISKDCIFNIAYQSIQGEINLSKVEKALDSLIRFLLQISNDFLPNEKGRFIKNNFYYLSK
ncbi:MAG: DUF4388 domain-containing protein [Oligoflexales bacterium]|nr:DUF4388 domain-containing protein [Oligoflexales bacterium]